MVFQRQGWKIESKDYGKADVSGRNITEKFTNHSLHATGATTLFDANVPEAIIQRRPGHSSTKALRMYKRVTPHQDPAVSRILQSERKLSFKAAKQSVNNKSANDENIDYDASFSQKDLFENVDC